MEESDLLRIPEEVFYRYIFPNLGLNPILRLRRVCKQTKLYSDDYIRIHFSNQERVISQHGHPFGFFNLVKLPTSHLYLDNTGPAFFQDPCIPQFLELYSTKITHLRVRLFSACISEPENKFFCAFTNLQHLELETVDATTWQGDIKKKCYFPPNFRQLKTLKLHRILSPTRTAYLAYVGDILPFCPKLEFLRLAYQMDTGTVRKDEDQYQMVQRYVYKRAEKFPDEPNLKYLDLEHVKETRYGIIFSMLSFKHGIKLLNVDGSNYTTIRPSSPNTYPEYFSPAISFLNFWGYMLEMELPDLEQVVIVSTAVCTWGCVWRKEWNVPRWPNLKVLHITIDSEKLDKSDFIDQNPTDKLLMFLFQSNVRENLRDLLIGFDESREGRGKLPIPRAQHIVATCKFVTKLTLINWIGTNKALSQLWKGLLFVQELVIEDCKTLGNVAFVGENTESPTFFCMTVLRKFTLGGLEMMPKVTDTVFKLVFSQLETIREFCLNSRKPVTSVTIEGIRFLLTGNFNKKVEKFPFTGWSLANVSDEEFSNLGSEFRASHML